MTTEQPPERPATYREVRFGLYAVTVRRASGESTTFVVGLVFPEVNRSALNDERLVRSLGIPYDPAEDAIDCDELGGIDMPAFVIA